jgi:hypothetical protein
MGNWKSFGFSNFDHSNLLGKKLAIGRLLGKWEIFGQLENPICPISQSRMEIGHWKIYESEKVNASFCQ